MNKKYEVPLISISLLSLAALLYQAAAADSEPFVISSASQKLPNLTPEGTTFSPLEGSGVKHTKTADTWTSEDTEREPEGKEYEYDEEGLGYGLELDFYKRDTREHHSHRGHRYRPHEGNRKGLKSGHFKVPFIDRNGK